MRGSLLPDSDLRLREEADDPVNPSELSQCALLRCLKAPFGLGRRSPLDASASEQGTGRLADSPSFSLSGSSEIGSNYQLIYPFINEMVVEVAAVPIEDGAWRWVYSPLIESSLPHGVRSLMFTLHTLHLLSRLLLRSHVSHPGFP